MSQNHTFWKGQETTNISENIVEPRGTLHHVVLVVKLGLTFEIVNPENLGRQIEYWSDFDRNKYIAGWALHFEEQQIEDRRRQKHIALVLLHFELTQRSKERIWEFGLRPEYWICRMNSSETLIRYFHFSFDRQGHRDVESCFWFHGFEWRENARDWISDKAIFVVKRRGRSIHEFGGFWFRPCKKILIKVFWRVANCGNQNRSQQCGLDRRGHGR